MIRSSLITIATMLMLAIANPAMGDDDNERARAMVQKGEFIPLVEIIKRVQTQLPGDILEVEIYEEDDESLYEIDILDSSDELHEVMVDPYTGEILRIEPHH